MWPGGVHQTQDQMTCRAGVRHDKTKATDMAFQNNILSFDRGQAMERPSALPERHRAVVERCRQVMQERLSNAIKRMFEKLDDALYDLADKAESNLLQTSYFDALREMRKERERIEASFDRNVRDGFARFWQYGPVPINGYEPQQEQTDEPFSLIDNAELEEGLAVNNMISRGENRHYQALYALHQRFAEMQGGGVVDERSNPLAPAALCYAFRDAVHGIELDVPVKLVIYKQFEYQVVDALEDLYHALNEVLIGAGVLPKLVRQVQHRSGRGTAGDAAHEGVTGTAVNGAQGGDDGMLQAELFSALKQLLNQRRGGQAPVNDSVPANLPVVDTAELVNALSALQRTPLPSDGGVVVSGLDVRTNLLQSMGLGQGADAQKRIESNDEDAIDVISMLFEFILEDRNLPDAMKALLARLQIPMLKVAILDRTFFSHKGHPARRLLNSMAQAAIGWTEEAGRAEGGLYARMESIVDQVLTSFTDDVSLFADLHEAFVRFLEKEKQGAQITEQRAAQVTQGKEQLELARRRIASEIDARLLGRDDLPPVVEKLLRDGWKDVLMLIHLREGESSAAWQEALGVMDRLLWSVQPKQEKAQRQQLLEEIPQLLKKLRSGLDGISYDQHRMSQLFGDLQRCHVACLAGNDPLQTVEKEAETGPSRTRSPDLKVDAAAPLQSSAENRAAAAGMDDGTGNDGSAPDDEYLRMARNLMEGDWLEVANEKGRTFRAKLSWRSRITGNSLFVSRKGLKVAELTLEELAEWFRSGKALRLKDVNVPLLDRAMNAMVRSLSNTGG